MVDSTDSDMLMYFVYKGSDPIAAEGQSSLVATDKLTSDFKTGKFFEVEAFSFAIKLEDDEGGEGSDDDNVETDDRSYARWRSLKNDNMELKPKFLAEPEDFSFTRLIDASSPILLQHCLDVQKLDKAVLVKRRRVAATGSLTGFLRMEFEKVWIKSIDWEDGDAVHETIKFKYASLKVTYQKRKPDGTTASSWPCKWEPPANG